MHREAETTNDAQRRGRIGANAALLCALLVPPLLTWAWSHPAAAPPREMPPLVLEPAAVRAQLASDRTAAARAPRGTAADARSAAYRAANETEQEEQGTPAGMQARTRELARALAALPPDRVGAVRAADTERLERALRAPMSDDERTAELGGFVHMLERYGLSRGGRQRAPQFVVRTLFKARWNALHSRELIEGFSAIERRAYWGWLALAADGAPLERRLAALEQYREAGGTRVGEARAVLLYDAEQFDAARDSFDRAYQARASFRLRNHALACREASRAPSGAERSEVSRRTGGSGGVSPPEAAAGARRSR